MRRCRGYLKVLSGHVAATIHSACAFCQQWPHRPTPLMGKSDGLLHRHAREKPRLAASRKSEDDAHFRRVVRGTVLVGEPCEQCACDVQCRVETLLEVADDSTSIVEEVARVQCLTVTCVLCQVARKSANFRREFKGNVSASCTAVMAILSNFGSDEMRR